MNKYLRFALVIALVASAAPLALANPGGGMPQPQISDLSTVSVAVAAVLSILNL